MKPGSIVHEEKRDGKHIVVRYLSWDDVDHLLVFANELSKEDTFVQLSGEVLTREGEIDYVSQALKRVETNSAVHLVAFVDGQFAANASIIKGTYRKLHVGTLAIAVTESQRNMKLGSLLMDVLMAEAPRIGISLVKLTCLSNNLRALHVYEKAGFMPCGRIPGAILYRGNYVDEIIWCKNIGDTNHKEDHE